MDDTAPAGEYDEGMQALLQIVWGEGFLSPGGPAEVARVLEGTNLRGRRVLDIGSGLGAVDVLLVREHGAASVVGLDLEAALVAKARERAAREGLSGRIEFRRVDPGPLPLANASFDVVFSKDSMVQIPDKRGLFGEVRRVLVPGGWFVAGDWLHGRGGAYSPEMLEFIRLEAITYNLATEEATAGALRAAGFTDVEIRDRSAWYTELAARELRALNGEWRALAEQRIGRERTAHFIADWEQLMVVLRSGELRPAHLRARAPLAGAAGG